MFDILSLSDVFDILIVALFIYAVLIFIKQTRSYFIFYALVFLFAAYSLSQYFSLSLTRQLVQPLLTFIIVIFVVVFQREIRRFFVWTTANGRRWSIERQLSRSTEMVKDVVDAVIQMAKQRIGALIVFAGDDSLDLVAEGGYLLEGRVSIPLLLSIFDATSPGHDGAVIIDNYRIKRFGSHLPLAENLGKVSDYGTRHRAALGISERTDALTIVVSEEKGTISVAEGGQIIMVEDDTLLENRLREFLKENEPQPSSVWQVAIKHNLWAKVVAVVVAIILWFVLVYNVGTTSQSFVSSVEVRYLSKDLMIEQIQPKEVYLNLSGNYRDLRALEKKDIKVYVDLSNATSGVQEARLTEENLSFPLYLSLIDYSPKKVWISIKPNETR